MARPKQEGPTEGELEVLQLLWEHGPQTVREVMDRLNPTRPRAYTSVMSLLNVMAEKGLVRRTPQGRAFLYEASVERSSTLGNLIRDLLGRAFEGSASALVAQLLSESHPDSEELDQIRKTIDQYAGELNEDEQ